MNKELLHNNLVVIEAVVVVVARFEPTTSHVIGVCFTTVLRPLPLNQKLAFKWLAKEMWKAIGSRTERKNVPLNENDFEHK